MCACEKIASYLAGVCAIMLPLVARATAWHRSALPQRCGQTSPTGGRGGHRSGSRRERGGRGRRDVEVAEAAHRGRRGVDEPQLAALLDLRFAGERRRVVRLQPGCDGLPLVDLAVDSRHGVAHQLPREWAQEHAGDLLPSDGPVLERRAGHGRRERGNGHVGFIFGRVSPRDMRCVVRGGRRVVTSPQLGAVADVRAAAAAARCHGHLESSVPARRKTVARHKGAGQRRVRRVVCPIRDRAVRRILSARIIRVVDNPAFGSEARAR
eukprot:scaffold3418_cov124-Isochrysis_galbana.AAC.8